MHSKIVLEYSKTGTSTPHISFLLDRTKPQPTFLHPDLNNCLYEKSIKEGKVTSEKQMLV